VTAFVAELAAPRSEHPMPLPPARERGALATAT
jgi:hypothetical protein